MKTFAGSWAADASRPQTAALARLPVFDAFHRQRFAARPIVFSCVAAQRVGQICPVGRQANKALRVTIEVVGAKQPADRLALAVTWRPEDHQALDLIVRHRLQHVDQHFRVTVELIARVDAADKRAEGKPALTPPLPLRRREALQVS